jgi:hypothetical protein
MLGCPRSTNNAIELDDDHVNARRPALPEPVLASANFISCRASLDSFAFFKLHTPFDLG